MMPIDILVKEHQLLRQMLAVLAEELKRMHANSRLDTAFVDTAVDFIRTYADRTHHGKEEEILFKALVAKPVSAEHRKTIDDLVAEHTYVRNKVTMLIAAKELYEHGSQEAFVKVADVLRELLGFYPGHMEKEEKQFFVPSMGYFTGDEKDRMLRDMQQFDASVIHEKYANIIAALEERCR